MTLAGIIRGLSAAIKAWLHENALWLVGLGLMLASSGIDGAYMARLMSWPALGYVLNTTSDIAGMVVMYYYGRLLKDNGKGSKKYKMAGALLGSEVVAVFYSWYFGWLQLRIIMQPIEPRNSLVISGIVAAFIPLLLAFIGFAQSLIVTPPDAAEKPLDTKAVSSGAKVETTGQPVAAIVPPVVTIERPVVTNEKPPAAIKTIDAPLWRSLVAKMDGDAPLDAQAVNRWLAVNGYEQKAVTTARRWATIAQEAHDAKSNQ